MKRLIRLFCLIAAATALGSCARDKVIPDEELARIFRDAYLINAYVSDRGVKLDSLELYEPVFSRYGYTAEDVRYTIGNFSRRKSAKLSDVVEQSIRLLEEESAYYKYEVGVLDTIDNVARRRFTRTVYSDSLIRVTRNLAPRMRVWLVEADSSRKGESSSILRKSSRERVSRILQADSSARSLVLSLYGTREKFRRPDVTIYDLKVSYTPETAEAVDSLYIDQLGLKIFADEFFSVFSPDSLQLPLHGEASR